jgi:hypothetical protein
LTTLSLILGFLVLSAIGFAVRPSRIVRRSRARRAVGCMLVVPLPLAVALHLLVRPEATVDRITFVVGAVAFAVGAVLVLPWSDDEGGGTDSDADPPPWWPAFEREFRAYTGESRRLRA